MKYLDLGRFTPILVSPAPDELSEEAGALGIKTFFIPFARFRSLDLGSIVRGLYRLLTILRQEKVDIIHTDSPRETAYAACAGRLLKLPVVMHLRVTDTQAWVDRVIYHCTDRLIAVSESVAARFVLLDRKKKVRVIYNGVEPTLFETPQPVHQRHVVKVGYFGRIHRRKGLEVLIKACRRLSHLPVQLVIMGAGDPFYLKELQSLAAEERTVFKDYQREAVREIADVDIVVLPSLRGEGLSRMLIEAMALGKTVIASDLSENREVVGDACKEYLFPVGDDAALAVLIEKVASQKDLRERNAVLLRQRARDCFDIRSNTRQIEDLYRECVTPLRRW